MIVLPSFVVLTPGRGGPSKEMVAHLDELLDDYYVHRGWDNNGIPTEAKLTELGLA